jgi:hypothetical protein
LNCRGIAETASDQVGKKITHAFAISR